MTAEQFERLKAELEASFQGTRNAGRPLLLEGGLDWKAMSLSPRDLDFMEAKHAAAREIALGDRRAADAARHSRRQHLRELRRGQPRVLAADGAAAGATHCPRALAAGSPRPMAASCGSRPTSIRSRRLSPEREALWARMERASFLTDDEKRAAVGYGANAEGGDSATRPFARKYREDQARDDQGTVGGRGARPQRRDTPRAEHAWIWARGKSQQ